MTNNEFRLGDEVVIYNPSSKFHKCRGKIIDITHHINKYTWVIVEIKISDRAIRIMFPEGRFLIKVDR